jgi:hypothetical protein
LPLGHSDTIQYALDDRICIDTVRFGLEAQDETMAQYVRGNRLYVFRTNEVATGKPGVRARCAVDTHARARAGTIHHLAIQGFVNAAGIAGRNDDVNDVFLQLGRQVQVQDLLSAGD